MKRRLRADVVAEQIGDNFYDLILDYVNGKPEAQAGPLVKLDAISVLQEVLRQARLLPVGDARLPRLHAFVKTMMTDDFFNKSSELDELAPPS